jgi:hypothetical protein
MLNLRTFTIQRLSTSEEGTAKKAYAATGGVISGFLENASAEFVAIVDGEFGKTFNLFSDAWETDIKIGDRVIDEDDGQSYDVKGTQKYLDGPGRKIQITMTLGIDQ